MARVFFTSHLERHLDCPPRSVDASTVREAIDVIAGENPRLARYILDDQKNLRQHIAVFVDGRVLEDRARMSDPVEAETDIYIMQALSGGRTP